MPLPRVSRLPPGPNLAQFLQRAQVLTFYREILRSARGHPSKNELKEYVRGEFERYRNEKDAEKVKYLLMMGKQEMKKVLPVSVDLSRPTR